MEASSLVISPSHSIIQASHPSSKSLLAASDLIKSDLIKSERAEAELRTDSEWLDDRPVEAAIVVDASSATIAKTQQDAEQETTSQFWKVFGSTFITIFLAELGDKTQVATLLMTAESHAPWVVFAGAATALITTSLLGVLVGQWLSARVSPKTLDTAAGITLAFISIWLLLEVVSL